MAGIYFIMMRHELEKQKIGKIYRKKEKPQGMKDILELYNYQ